eukprot:TRINITY_DN349_c0_g1_i8.p1 TRINITY_DN349_c0_g1~~TRINITY_DN349_c0_g1_i8.p1  ORF type:complete len:485 (+),score=158.52 TRINITY_DN349_c0_g1_i8:34-1455(+)
MIKTNVALFLLIVATVCCFNTMHASASTEQIPTGERLVRKFFGFANERGDVPKATDCAACTIILSLMEQLAVINEQSIENVVDEFCDLFPPEFEKICTYFVNNYGADIIKGLENGLGPDLTCRKIDICIDAATQCKLFPKGTRGFKGSSEDLLSVMPKGERQVSRQVGESPWDWIKDLINRLANGHEPIYDLDSDNFSKMETLRGADWRGKDCDDFDKDTYPGRRVTKEATDKDYNCNGIYGKDTNGVDYEEMFCANSSAMGTIVLGDSAAAHFHIPPQYLTAKDINKTTYDNLLPTLENEFDWPQCSMYTGHTEACPGPMNSIYTNMVQRNRCNHRDFQNIGVNGCRSGSMSPPGVINSLARDQFADKPALVFHALIGNDICTPHHTLDRMTTPPAFKANVLKSLEFLDTKLPPGSHVMFIGVVDGRVLWDLLHDDPHPIGNGVSYADVYDYLNCLELNPCWAWLNRNETIR